MDLTDQHMHLISQMHLLAMKYSLSQNVLLEAPDKWGHE